MLPYQAPCRHEVWTPLRQLAHVPSLILNGAITNSPGRTVVTASPTSSTMPTNSCPMRSGPRAGVIPRYGHRSDPQTHVATTRTIVLQMVLFTPVLLMQRWRQKRKLVQVPLVMREDTDDDDLLEAVETALKAAGVDGYEVEEATGPKSWPMRTMAFPAQHLLAAVVRGEPIRVVAGDLEVLAYATNIAINGPKERAYEVRAAVEREVAFCDAYLTWNDEAQELEDALLAADNQANGDLERLRRRLDRVQARIDRASLNSEEWNVLYRLRLQVEDRAGRRHVAG